MVEAAVAAIFVVAGIGVALGLVEIVARWRVSRLRRGRNLNG